MILRPVRPVSACGPPSSNAPVGFTSSSVVVVGELRRKHRLDDVVVEVGLEQRLEIEPGLVLRGDQHGAQLGRAPVLVVERDLRLAVGAQVRQHAGLAHLGQALRQTVRQPDRQRHQVVGLVARVAEHHPLVAGALGVEDVLAARAARGSRARCRRPVAMSGDCSSMRDDHAAGVAVEAEGLAVVADVAHGLAHELRDVDVGVGGDLTGDDDEPGGEQRLARDPARRVLGEDRVEHRVGDLVGHLVGMALGDRLRGERPLRAHVYCFSLAVEDGIEHRPCNALACPSTELPARLQWRRATPPRWCRARTRPLARTRRSPR